MVMKYKMHLQVTFSSIEFFIIFLKDTYNTFYKGNSGADRGTMFHIRNTFGHRNVTKEVTKSFNYNAELLEFTTRGLTVLLAKNLIEEILQTQGKYGNRKRQSG